MNPGKSSVRTNPRRTSAWGRTTARHRSRPTSPTPTTRPASPTPSTGASESGSAATRPAGQCAPSFMVTCEEKHTIRGRARLLFEMMSGHLRDDQAGKGWRDKNVKEALDRPVPRLQRLQGRLPGRRRHRHLQGRVPVAASPSSATNSATCSPTTPTPTGSRAKPSPSPNYSPGPDTHRHRCTDEHWSRHTPKRRNRTRGRQRSDGGDGTRRHNTRLRMLRHGRQLRLRTRRELRRIRRSWRTSHPARGSRRVNRRPRAGRRLQLPTADRLTHRPPPITPRRDTRTSPTGRRQRLTRRPPQQPRTPSNPRPHPHDPCSSQEPSPRRALA